MQIRFNGLPRELESGRRLIELLGELNVNLGGVAVAVNGKVIAASELENRTLSEGDRVEVIEAVGGG